MMITVPAKLLADHLSAATIGGKIETIEVNSDGSSVVGNTTRVAVSRTPPLMGYSGEIGKWCIADTQGLIKTLKQFDGSVSVENHGESISIRGNLKKGGVEQVLTWGQIDPMVISKPKESTVLDNLLQNLTIRCVCTLDALKSLVSAYTGVGALKTKFGVTNNQLNVSIGNDFMKQASITVGTLEPPAEGCEGLLLDSRLFVEMLKQIISTGTETANLWMSDSIMYFSWGEPKYEYFLCLSI